MAAGSAAAEPDSHLGPSASVSLGPGYSVAEGESGGISIVGLADLGWFVTDRFALLVGGTVAVRPGNNALHHHLWRFGLEYRLDPKHYLRLAFARSILGRGSSNREADEGIDNIGKGEGVQLIAGIPASNWRWGEVSFQLILGGGFHHGDDNEASYAGFAATCLEFAVR